MKSFLTILLFYALLTAPAKAQRFRGGVMAGISTTQIEGDGYGGFNKAGLQLGGYVNTDISEKLIGQFEIIYINKGSKDPANQKTTYYIIRLNYIEIPLLLRYKFKKFIFEGGLSYGRLVKEEQEDEQGIILHPGQGRGIGIYKKAELAYQLGATYAISDKLFVCWRNSASILPIADEMQFSYNWFRFVGGSFNVVVAFSLRYQFIKDVQPGGEK